MPELLKKVWHHTLNFYNLIPGIWYPMLLCDYELFTMGMSTVGLETSFTHPLIKQLCKF